jgi:hypothetical protein
MALDATLEGDFEVDVKIDSGDSLASSLIENITREDMNPVDEAWGIKRLIDERGYSKLGAAQAIGKSQAFITNRLEILELPEKCVEQLAKGRLPVSAVKSLKAMAKVSSTLAIRAATRCGGKEHWGGILAKSPAQIANLLGQDDKEPFWLIPGEYDADWLRAVAKSRDDRDYLVELAGELDSFSTEYHKARCRPRKEHADGALALGVAYPIDAEKGHVLCADPEPIIQAIAAEVRERQQVEAARAKENAKQARAQGKSPAQEGDVDADAEEARKAAERAAREAEAAQRVESRGCNLSVGAKLLSAVVEMGRSDDVIRLICLELIGALRFGHVTLSGLRYLLPQLQVEEHTPAKGDKPARTKVSYLQGIGEAEAAAKAFVAGASTADELLQRTLLVLLACEGADQRAVAESQRRQNELAGGLAAQLRRKLVAGSLSPVNAEHIKADWKQADEDSWRSKDPLAVAEDRLPDEVAEQIAGDPGSEE